MINEKNKKKNEKKEKRKQKLFLMITTIEWALIENKYEHNFSPRAHNFRRCNIDATIIQQKTIIINK